MNFFILFLILCIFIRGLWGVYDDCKVIINSFRHNPSKTREQLNNLQRYGKELEKLYNRRGNSK